MNSLPKKKQNQCMKKSINLNLVKYKAKPYILGCSFGPDSMALLNMLIEQKYDVVVAFVNYHKREASKYEEKSLKEFCKIHNIKFYGLDCRLLHKPENANFQAWARDVRYNFFKKIYDQEDACGLLIAHNQDDAIETYLLQQKRGSTISYFGLPLEKEYLGMKIFRPLLDIKKKDLQKYDDDNDVPYSIDCSNLTDDYERNKIRHHIVEKLSDEERLKYLSEIKSKNEEILFKQKILIKYIHDNVLYVEELEKLDDTLLKELLIYYFNKNNVYSLSNGLILEIKKNFKSTKSNIVIKLNDEYYLAQEYKEISIQRYAKPYSYIIKEPSHFKCEYFEIDFKNGFDRNITPDSFPLTIRSPKKDDIVYIDGHKQTISRLFINFKMPYHLRALWPLILNKDGKIIYVARYRKDYVDNHKTIFKILLK